MTRYGKALAALVATAALTACSSGSGSSGGGSASTPATSPATTAPTTTSASPSDAGGLTAAIDLDLSNRLLRRSEWPGATIAATQFFTPAQAGALHPQDAAAETARLVKEGLVALAAEQISLPGSGGVASVTRFRTAAGAKAEAAHGARAPGTRPFTVAGIPDASGVEILQNGSVVARNIAFVVGAYIYTVGTAVNGPTVPQLTAIATTWHARVAHL